MLLKVIKPILLGLVCALLLAGMQGASKERIAQNKQRYAEQTLRDMLAAGAVRLVRVQGPGNRHYQIFQVLALLKPSLLAPSSLEPSSLEPASLEPASLEPPSLELSGNIMQQHTYDGYNGHIAFWVAIDRQGEIIGVRTFAHQETPGLGDKIERQVSPWIDLFKGLSLANTEAADWALTQEGGQFDSITGATITSRASIRAVRAALLEDAQQQQQQQQRPRTEETQ